MTRLSQAVQRGTYRRPVKDKPLRVLWREDGKERRKAYSWWGPAWDELGLHEKRHEAALLVDLDKDRVTTWAWMSKPEWRKPTPEEVERILSLKLTRDSR